MKEKSPKKKSSVSVYSFKFFEKKQKKSLEGRFQKKMESAVSGTELTVSTETGKTIHRNVILDLIIFQKERNTESSPKIGDTITPKNWHCLRGVDGKYIQWNEILKDVLNGKLKLVQNKKTEADSESEEGEIEDEESDFENHDTSERDGYRPITTSPDDELSLHTDGELITGENKENITTQNKKLDDQTGKESNRIDTLG